MRDRRSLGNSPPVNKRARGQGKPSVMRLSSTSWKQLFFYGEIVGFLLAWIVGIVVTLQADPEEPRLSGVEQFVSVTDLRGSNLE
ncbi:MAG: hypothetical protein ACR2NU_14820 [Aeoliella sp.]